MVDGASGSTWTGTTVITGDTTTVSVISLPRTWTLARLIIIVDSIIVNIIFTSSVTYQDDKNEDFTTLLSVARSV